MSDRRIRMTLCRSLIDFCAALVSCLPDCSNSPRWLTSQATMHALRWRVTSWELFISNRKRKKSVVAAHNPSSWMDTKHRRQPEDAGEGSTGITTENNISNAGTQARKQLKRPEMSPKAMAQTHLSHPIQPRTHLPDLVQQLLARNSCFFCTSSVSSYSSSSCGFIKWIPANLESHNSIHRYLWKCVHCILLMSLLCVLSNED